MTVRNRWLRAIAAFAGSTLISVTALLLLGLVLPALVLTAIYGTGEDLTPGVGLFFVVAMLALATPFLILLWSLTVRFYESLGPRP